MPPREDELMRALVNLTTKLSDDERLAFLRQALGVTAVAADGAVSAEARPPVPYELENDRIVLIGLAPTTDVAWPEGGTSNSGSIVDAVFSQFGRLTVLVAAEVQGSLDGRRLLRHAAAWDMPVAQERWDELPRGIGVVAWNQVALWLGEVAATHEEAGALREQLRELEPGPAEIDPPDRTPAVPRGEEPPAALLDDMLGQASPAEVRAIVVRLYGSSGPFHVTGDGSDTKRDAREVAARFEQAGEPVPGSLFDTGPGGIGDVITPARALSMLAGAKPLARRHLIAPAWTEVRDHMVFRGADRGLAVAMWSFADALSGPDHRRLRAHAGRMWTVAPPHSHATPALTDALREAGIELAAQAD